MGTQSSSPTSPQLQSADRMPIEFFSFLESFGHHVLVGIPLTVSLWLDVDNFSSKHWRLTIRRTAKLEVLHLLDPKTKKHSSIKYIVRPAWWIRI